MFKTLLSILSMWLALALRVGRSASRSYLRLLKKQYRNKRLFFDAFAI
jgi:hypothetical protein